MKLRIVAGSLKGRFLTIPERDTGFRPTRERVRESVAGILSPRIHGAVVADICAGSGAFGFEMISRGAGRVFFVESDPYRVRRLLEHAHRFGVAGQCSVEQRETGIFARECRMRFDIIYFDPPYEEPHFPELVPRLSELLTVNGVMVYERRSRGKKRLPLVQFTRPFFSDRRIYGETEICFFENREVDDTDGTTGIDAPAAEKR